MSSLPLRGECILLDYPDYPNAGDHMIWLGEALYLAQRPDLRVVYSSSIRQLSENALRAPRTILFNGGGNFGDLWPRHQKSRERMIGQYRDRPIIILPQTIYFRDPENLKAAARICNAHPDLTILVRDETSLETAREHFGGCRIVAAPDMAFQLAGRLQLTEPPGAKGGLYLCRTDIEQPPGASSNDLGLGHLAVADWASIERSWRGIWWGMTGPNRLGKSLARLLRENTRDLGGRFREWRSFRNWMRTLDFGSLPRSALQRRSAAYVHAAAWQFAQYQTIVSTRLHGHILALLLGKPNVLLPNSYHKNESFFRTWTKDLSKGAFSTQDRAMQAESQVSGRPLPLSSLYRIERNQAVIRIVDHRENLIFEVKPAAIVVMDGVARPIAQVGDRELLETLFQKGLLK